MREFAWSEEEIRGRGVELKGKWRKVKGSGGE
jgi:hypothetical protein